MWDATLIVLLQLSNLKILTYAFTPSSSPLRQNSPNSMKGVRQNSPLSMVLPSPLEKIERDFQALTRRVTAYHILLPKSTEAALTLKQKIRNRVNPPKSRSKSETDDDDLGSMYIIDAFSQAARRYSLDDETKSNGGQLGTMLPQGACRRVPELDKACFEVPLGQVAGPIETEYGFHLLLVEERTNCAKLDGVYSKIVRGGVDGTETVFVRPNGKEEGSDFVGLILNQLGLWVGILFAGGIVAELAVRVADGYLNSV